MTIDQPSRAQILGHLLESKACYFHSCYILGRYFLPTYGWYHYIKFCRHDEEKQPTKQTILEVYIQPNTLYLYQSLSENFDLTQSIYNIHQKFST